MESVKYFIKNFPFAFSERKSVMHQLQKHSQHRNHLLNKLYSDIWPIFYILLLKEVVGKGNSEHFPSFCNKLPVLAHNGSISCYFFLGISTTSLFMNI